MASFSYSSVATYMRNGGSENYSLDLASVSDTSGTITDVDGDAFFENGEPLNAPESGTFHGTTTDSNGNLVMIVDNGDGTISVYAQDTSANIDFSGMSPIHMTNDANTSDLQCFAKGTLIATPNGERPVEELTIGDTLTCADGGVTTVLWVGRQRVNKLFLGARMQPVRIRAGALGDGLPHTDLTVTADHGMIMDGVVVNASVMVNGDTVEFVPARELEDTFTVYHIETENHDVILANGAHAESFIDYVGRQAFENYREYEALYGSERIIPEMTLPRVSSLRTLPSEIRARMGMTDLVHDLDDILSA
ncbi:Hint domain-containing protein [Primorskyibacter aestuariivivens]|uniref:Hint domain-containing protein n=1 Tax=Primorskyibacter aestuariivivens TaxID=1888912 RepID=UPI0023019D2C|nr:Hint domain-containing protein [Primorskyibacter aestuariivivens]MDA7427034.1 Hint domain-containing protein [Primorskyibacter aestuariivivens]